ncbi:MAG: hypothetical protein EOO05_13660 [Chitinophagaceae bacterium]|nr:MAG: hypothetical protein EOO05_13660 [Chitinophagaceae bacterium]
MKKTWNYWTVCLLFTITCIVINSTVFAFPCMLNLEFAKSAAAMEDYIRPSGYHRLLMNTLVDYGFLIGYGLLAFFSLKIILEVFQGNVNSWIYLLSFITGALDAFENIFLLLSATRERAVYSDAYFWAVRIKWATAIIIVLVIAIVIIFSLIVLLRARPNRSSGT